MTNYIIKACGSIQDVTKQLQTITAIFGKGATLSDVATVARYSNLRQVVKNQFEKDGKSI